MSGIEPSEYDLASIMHRVAREAERKAYRNDWLEVKDTSEFQRIMGDISNSASVAGYYNFFHVREKAVIEYGNSYIQKVVKALWYLGYKVTDRDGPELTIGYILTPDTIFKVSWHDAFPQH